MATKECKWQFIEPSNHRVNAAKRAIQTFKNHMISSLGSTDSKWPMQLWDQLTTQAIITLNLCRVSRREPTKSAYHSLHGQRYDWNAHTMAPPGTRAVVYEDPKSRRSWGPRAIYAWYCGPSLDHHQNCRFYVPEIGAYQTSGLFDLFPRHCLLQELTQKQHVEAVHNELIETMQELPLSKKQILLRKMTERIAGILASKQTQKGESGGTLKAPLVTTTTDPTNPRNLVKKILTHQRQTSNNVPGELPKIQTRRQKVC